MSKKTTPATESVVTGPEKATPEVDKTAETPTENSASTRITPQMEFVAPSDLYLQLVEPRELKKGRKALCYLYVPIGWYEGYLNPEVTKEKYDSSIKSYGALALIEKDPLRNKDNLNVFRMKKGDVLSAVNGNETDTERKMDLKMEIEMETQREVEVRMEREITGNRDVEVEVKVKEKKKKGISLKNSEGATISSMKLKDTYLSDKDLRTVFSVKESKTEPVRVSLIPMSEVVKLKLKLKGFIRVFDGERFSGLNGDIVAPEEGVFAIVLTDKLPSNYFKGKPNYTFTLNPGGRIEAETGSSCDIIRVVPSKNVLEEEVFAS